MNDEARYLVELLGRAGIRVDRLEGRKVYGVIAHGFSEYRCDSLRVGVHLEVSSELALVPLVRTSGLPREVIPGVFLCAFPTSSGRRASLTVRTRVPLLPDARAIAELTGFRERVVCCHEDFWNGAFAAMAGFPPMEHDRSVDVGWDQ